GPAASLPVASGGGGAAAGAEVGAGAGAGAGAGEVARAALSGALMLSTVTGAADAGPARTGWAGRTKAFQSAVSNTNATTAETRMDMRRSTIMRAICERPVSRR